MTDVRVSREQLDALGQSPVLFDALVGEEQGALVFAKTVRPDDPGIPEQRVTPGWPRHLPGELTIALTGQAGVIALRRGNVIDETWRGHGVRIRDARFSAPVLVGETFFMRVEVGRIRRVGRSLHVGFRFRAWKHGPDGGEIETYRSEQDAIFYPAGG
jgi:hypothetical protein